jgi:hypothetical protein
MSRSLAALVIGNSKYKKAGKLKNPANDAADIADALTACGFTVTTLVDGSHKQMDKALSDFKAGLKGNDVGLFFFAGHGVQIAGENYLAAVDTKTADETEAKHSSLALNKVIDTMEASNTTTNIVILDACRNNPWDRAWRGVDSRGLAPVYAPRGTLIAYATSQDQPGVHVLDVKLAQSLHRDRLMIDLPVLGRVLALRDLAELDLRFTTCGLRCPDTVKTDGVAARPALSPVLNDVAALAGHEHAQTETGQFIVPDDILAIQDLRGLDGTQGELGHQRPPRVFGPALTRKHSVSSRRPIDGYAG